MKKIIVIGGVAGGASAAARARRLSEDSEITIIERGNFVSFANCGLPYHIGNIIKDRDALFLQTPDSLKKRFNINVLVNHEAISIDRQNKTVRVKEVSSEKEAELKYDNLILSPGAEPFKPALPGINFPNIFTLRTIPDMDRIIECINNRNVKHAIVVGGGFIGLEVIENLINRKISVILIERENQVMPPMDPEMTSIIHQHLKFHGVDLKLGTQLNSISQANSRLAVQISGGNSFETDMVILAIGVKPEVKLAKDAGLKIGERGGIAVDEFLKTSDPDIYAIGDAAEIFDRLSGERSVVPLAGPANRQGRLSADSIFLPERKKAYKGTQGTWICKIFDYAAAQTGLSEKSLKRKNRAFSKVYLHPENHAGYYPNSFPMTIKLLFDPQSGRILGAQIIGTEGVDKRIDVLATAIAGQMTVEDLTNLELAYAPPFGSAKDPINMAGMIAQNIISGEHRALWVEELDSRKKDEFILVDVRTPTEFGNGNIPGSINIPIDQLRERLSEIPKEKEIFLYCQVGFRGYLAQRVLSQKGFSVKNLIGGYKTWAMYHEDALKQPQPKTVCEIYCSESKEEPIPEGEVFELDACGLQCPGPLLKMREKMEILKSGQILKVYSTDPGFLNDSAAWCSRSGNRLVQVKSDHGRYIAVIQKSNITTSSNSSSDETCTKNLLPKKDALTMVVFSGDLDKAYATFIIANGAAAMGMKVTLFFTFWGLNILRKTDAPPVNKGIVEKMFGMMMPMGPDALKLSKMNFAGLGTAMMKQVMSEKNVEPLPNLIKQAMDAGVKMVACTMSMNVMGLKKEELFDGIEEGGVAHYLNYAADSSINLFV
ncbi:MAG: FAD-dependent oxidoreductase [Candidatus Riflebacteria bacterium]|nr:FAD-dependent oxidoreductase [Candidatus Riflebacteria bacterium]